MIEVPMFQVIISLALHVIETTVIFSLVLVLVIKKDD